MTHLSPGWIASFALSIALSTPARAAVSSAAVSSAWVQYADDGKPVLRAVSTEARCPPARVDGKAVSLKPRAAATADFPTVCEARIDPAARTVTVGGKTLAGPARVTRGVQRILLIGDTGCRIKGDAVQDCNDPKAWPFPAIARAASLTRPDLVIHVGDYYYRESPCPTGAGGAPQKGCAGSPYGDKWATWDAEFFAPAAGLLAAAPWIFVRGNHESCARGGKGWFTLLDASTPAPACPRVSTPFTVSLGPGRPRVHVMDSADTEDITAPADKVALFKRQFDALGDTLEHGHSWIVTHRPIWGINPAVKSDSTGKEEDLPVNLTEQVAAEGRTLAGVDAVLAGHVHIFAAESFGPARPAQIIAGNGGDVPTAAEADAVTRRFTVAGMDTDAFVLRHYGYTVLDRKEEGWVATVHAADGKVFATCDLRGRAVSCRKAR